MFIVRARVETGQRLKEGKRKGRGKRGRKEGRMEGSDGGRETKYLMEFKLTFPKSVIIVEEKIEFILLGLSKLTFFVYFSDMGVWITHAHFCDSKSSSCSHGNH